MRFALRLVMGGVLAVLGGAVASAGTTFIFNGIFTQDDQQAAYTIVLNTPQVVTIETTSYANGGFAPVLSLFGDPLFGPGDPSLRGTNSGGTPCGVRATNVATGACLDALLGFDSVLGTNTLGILEAGTYLLIVTEQDNTPVSPDLAAGFTRDGQGNFTAIPGLNNGPFVDPGNPTHDDTGSFQLQANNVDFAAPANLPEPSTMLSLFGGLGILAGMRRRRT